MSTRHQLKEHTKHAKQSKTNEDPGIKSIKKYQKLPNHQGTELAPQYVVSIGKPNLLNIPCSHIIACNFTSIIN